jgi:hypothetical protein
MEGKILSQLRHNKHYLKKMEIKRKGKISIATGVSAIFAGLALYCVMTSRELYGLTYSITGLLVMVVSAMVFKPHEE